MTVTLSNPVEIELVPHPYHWTVESYYRAWDSGVFGHDAKLELISGRIIERFAEGGPADYRWTVDAFYRAAEAGVFDWDARLELIRGKVIDRMPESALHAFLTTLIMQLMQAVFTAPHFVVRCEKPIRIAFDAEPVPDVSILRGKNADYRQRHPSPEDVALLVEVAISSAAIDTGEKALLYAQAGIVDYWVALPETGQLIVHREPTDAGYQSVTTLTRNAIVSPLSAPEATFVVSALFGEAEERVQEA